MLLVDIARITGHAAWVHQKAGLTGSGPPYSTHIMFPAVFPNVAVSGADLAPGVLEMVEHSRSGRRVLWYSRSLTIPQQRAALAHGFYHLMTDLRRPQRGHRECNVGLRGLEAAGAVPPSAIEAACDLFAGELLVPFAVLDRHAPMELFPDSSDRWKDQVNALASLFNVSDEFMVWRLEDLALLRQSHFYVR